MPFTNKNINNNNDNNNTSLLRDINCSSCVQLDISLTFFNVNDHFPMITNSSSASCDASPISATNNKRLLFSRGETKFDPEQLSIF